MAKQKKKYEARIEFNGQDIRKRCFSNAREAERFQAFMVDLRTAAKVGSMAEE